MKQVLGAAELKGREEKKEERVDLTSCAWCPSLLGMRS